MVRKAERSLRGLFSDLRVWILIAYVGLAALVVGLYVVNTRTARANTRVAKEAAVRQAERLASAKAGTLARKLKEAQCLQSRPQLRKINAFAAGVEELARILYANSQELVSATPPSDGQYQVRLRNSRRIARTVPAVSGIHFHVPTTAECHRLGKP